ncbi:UNVERIFIED_CONTAM: protein CHAPERONE-LIKE PROTEIN OF POR1, chloroplastic [Sesamum calycinum]|uniref:Protein CHAPERONE-LIKE PROTEIN OF POR1, chloroplastic n=1 Tax=Sesamum calycinum TaxID=2727403 RepID=A0AAW2SSJ0_9LAMI
MMSSGLTYCPLRYSPGSPTRGPGSRKKHVAFFPDFRTSKDLLYLPRNGLAASTWRYKRQSPTLKCAMDATFGDATNDSTAIFPRINVRDPYKRLGISREASEDEIQAARNFLIQTYGGHKPSVDAIESAHDKIIMQKFYERKNPKINIKKKGWKFYSFMASRNISDGVCDATNTQGAKKLGSDNFIDKLHYPLGFFYLSSIISIYTCPSFVRLTLACPSETMSKVVAATFDILVDSSELVALFMRKSPLPQTAKGKKQGRKGRLWGESSLPCFASHQTSTGFHLVLVVKTLL